MGRFQKFFRGIASFISGFWSLLKTLYGGARIVLTLPATLVAICVFFASAGTLADVMERGYAVVKEDYLSRGSFLETCKAPLNHLAKTFNVPDRHNAFISATPRAPSDATDPTPSDATDATDPTSTLLESAYFLLLPSDATDPKGKDSKA